MNENETIHFYAADQAARRAARRARANGDDDYGVFLLLLIAQEHLMEISAYAEIWRGVHQTDRLGELVRRLRLAQTPELNRLAEAIESFSALP